MTKTQRMHCRSTIYLLRNALGLGDLVSAIHLPQEDIDTFSDTTVLLYYPDYVTKDSFSTLHRNQNVRVPKSC